MSVWRPPGRHLVDRRRDATLPPQCEPRAGKIAAPMFPDGTGWLNVATLRMDQQHGRPVLVEFFDVCRVSSLRTLPYVEGVGGEVPRAARDLRALPRLSALARRGRRARRRGAARDRARGRARRAAWRSGSSTATRAGPGATSGTATCACSRSTTARAPTARPSEAIQELLGIEDELVEPLRPEDEPVGDAGRADGRAGGRLLRPLRGRRRLGGARGRRGRSASTAPSTRCPTRARTS